MWIVSKLMFSKVSLVYITQGLSYRMYYLSKKMERFDFILMWHHERIYFIYFCKWPDLAQYPAIERNIQLQTRFRSKSGRSYMMYNFFPIQSSALWMKKNLIKAWLMYQIRCTIITQSAFSSYDDVDAWPVV